MGALVRVRAVALLLCWAAWPHVLALAPLLSPPPPICSMACAGTPSCCCAKKARPHRSGPVEARAEEAGPSCPDGCATTGSSPTHPVPALLSGGRIPGPPDDRARLLGTTSSAFAGEPALRRARGPPASSQAGHGSSNP